MTLKPVLLRLPLALFALLILSGMGGGSGDESTGERQPQYDQNSWRDVIADDCRAFFDGCNNCRRGSGDSAMAACTRKACLVYQKPRCLDEAAKAADHAAPASSAIDYACAGDNTFSVAYHEYIEDDQRVKLSDSEVMLRDHQTDTTYRLQRQVSASGSKYSDSSGLTFFAKGDEALVNQQQTELYRNCVVKR
jgi:membrane-bound inhibitor of C-type lysozyme